MIYVEEESKTIKKEKRELHQERKIKKKSSEHGKGTGMISFSFVFARTMNDWVCT